MLSQFFEPLWRIIKSKIVHDDEHTLTCLYPQNKFHKQISGRRHQPVISFFFARKVSLHTPQMQDQYAQQRIQTRTPVHLRADCKCQGERSSYCVYALTAPGYPYIQKPYDLFEKISLPTSNCCSEPFFRAFTYLNNTQSLVI